MASLAVLFALFGLSGPVFADSATAGSDEGDIFAPGAFDSAAGANGGSASSSGGTSAAAASISNSAALNPDTNSKLVLGGSAVASAALYSPKSLDSYGASSSIIAKLFAKATVPDYGQLFISYGISEALLSSRSSDIFAYLAPAESLSVPSYALDEFYYSYDINKVLFFRAGKQLLAWGPSKIWTPVDFVNSKKLNFFAPMDTREGKSGLKVFAPFGTYNAYAFVDFSDTASSSGVNDLADSLSYVGRIEGTAGDFELGLSGLASGFQQDKLGFDFSGHLLGMAAYGEVAYGPAYSSYQNLWQASLGFSRYIDDVKKWNLSAEGFYNSQGQSYAGNRMALAALSASGSLLYSGQWYGYASLDGKDFPVSELETTFSYLQNYSDLSYRAAIDVASTLPGIPRCTMELAYYGGGQDKELTAAAGQDYFALTLYSTFDF